MLESSWTFDAGIQISVFYCVALGFKRLAATYA